MNRFARSDQTCCFAISEHSICLACIVWAFRFSSSSATIRLRSLSKVFREWALTLRSTTLKESKAFTKHWRNAERRPLSCWKRISKNVESNGQRVWQSSFHTILRRPAFTSILSKWTTITKKYEQNIRFGRSIRPFRMIEFRNRSKCRTSLGSCPAKSFSCH